MVPALPTSLAATLGVTRVARLTRLDRSSVEVAAAIRPGGYVLQVCNGKGETFAQAAAGALLEAAELWCAERVDPAALIFGSVEELSSQGSLWPPEAAGSAGELCAPELWTSQTRIAWQVARELGRGEEVLVPAQALHCPLPSQALLGPSVLRWTSNGMGAHPLFEAAASHALLEAVERDALARALPEGWTEAAVRTRMLARASLDQAPSTWARVRAVEEGGLKVFLFDLTPAEGVRLPLAAALLVDPDEGPVPLTAGYACALRRDDALLSALLEAAQSRLTDVHGAREDVEPADRQAMAILRGWCEGARPSRRVRSMPQPRARPARPSPGEAASDDLQLIARLLRRAGHAAALAQLAPPHLGIQVVKAVVPSFRISELL